ncbi:TPR end-of-group domain-containing protein [Azospirillum griseum]|uniref:Tetratricopeptide repeat protein n=1 Tax=Azospirillum griseum TaxID=2496639 RepID=A0A431VHD4_9PROT|nr:hypothetical protein [Azospirillum griseum]RTR19430.1 hypothetical protein EJ903_13090 [Azospirillum griseum]
MSGVANTSVEEIADCMRARKRANQACSLLIGAGCSVSAGIPLANGFVSRIQKEHGAAYRRAKTKHYPDVMAELGDGYRRDLVAEAIDKAHINWAHIAIAQLMKHGYVSRVLTTNFDPLVVRACAMVGEFPAVYDFAASQNFHPEYLPEKAVFYLHGQRDGFILLHTEEDVRRHSANLAPLFREAGQGRMWLVAGYSGENDPVFTHLEAVEHFRYNLTWARYEDEDPPPHLTQKLLKPGKGTLYLRGYDADRLFVELAQRLDCFPPDFISAPFQHLRNTLDRVGPFQLPHKAGPLDIVQEARKRIDHAETVVRSAADATRDRVLQAILRADYADAVRDVTDGAIAEDAELRGLMATAHFMLGVNAQQRGESATGKEFERAISTAIEQYQRCLALKPDKHEAWNNWGNALADQAKTTGGDDARTLFDVAGQKYAEAIAIKPDDHEAWYNWGIALFHQAKATGGDDARTLFDMAGQKYAKAIAIKPDFHEAWYNWGNALFHQARATGGDDARTLFDVAGQKYAKAIAIKPDKHEAWYNWGNALADQAKATGGDDARTLFDVAGQKFAEAIAIKPDFHEAWYNWGVALSDQAKATGGDDARTLFDVAGQKYAEAIAIKPDKHEAWNNWGNALFHQAKATGGDDARTLFGLAAQKYAEAIAIKPNCHEAWNNWGFAFLYLANITSGTEAAQNLAETDARYRRALSLTPNAPNTLYNLACLHSLRRNESACRMWLTRCLAIPHPNAKRLLSSDSDFDSLRDTPWFQGLLAAL